MLHHVTCEFVLFLLTGTFPQSRTKGTAAGFPFGPSCAIFFGRQLRGFIHLRQQVQEGSR